MRPLRAVFLLICLTSPVVGRDDAPLRPTLDLPAGRPYVGQPIEASLRVVAGATRPGLTVAPNRDFDVYPLNGVEVRPLSSTSIGRAREVTNAYRIPLRFVPKRAGSLRT